MYRAASTAADCPARRASESARRNISVASRGRCSSVKTPARTPNRFHKRRHSAGSVISIRRRTSGSACANSLAPIWLRTSAFRSLHDSSAGIRACLGTVQSVAGASPASTGPEQCEWGNALVCYAIHQPSAKTSPGRAKPLLAKPADSALRVRRWPWCLRRRVDRQGLSGSG